MAAFGDTLSLLSRPFKTRQSLGGPPDSQKENNARPSKHKRAQSLGGELGNQLLLNQGTRRASDEGNALSPRKKARRSLVPGRSILKASLGPSTTNGPLYTEDATTFNLTATQNYTQTQQYTATTTLTQTQADPNTSDLDRRKSLSRRVSFAPTAHLREYQKDNPEDRSTESTSSPASEPQPPQPLIPSAKRISFAPDTEESMDIAADEITSAFRIAPAYPSLDHLLDKQEPSFADADDDMDSVNPSEATSAFASNPVLKRQMQDEDTLEEEQVVKELRRVEYEVPLGAEGEEEDVEFGQEDTGSTMEMSMEVDDSTGVISDGKTSRRISTSGAVRRGSLAPGLKALAMLDEPEEEEEQEDLQEEAMEEDDDRTMDMEETAVYSQNSQPSQPPQLQSQSQSKSKPRFSLLPAIAQPSPAKSPRRQSLAAPLTSRIPLPAKTPERPRHSVAAAPSSLARPTPEVLERLETPPKVPRQSLPATTRQSNDTGSALLSLEEFFNLTGMQFMDDLFSAKRKSSAGDDAESTTIKAKPTFADQMVAMGCLVHMLEMYHSMARELRTVMNEDVEWMDDIAEKVERDVQPIFKRYMEAGEEERAAMETQFKIAKAHFRLQCRNEWYDYRYDALESVKQTINEHHEGIVKDKQVIETTLEQTNSVLPDLKSQQDKLEKALEVERARQTELDSCDPEHVAELQEAIAEQNTQIEDYAREQAEIDAQLERMQAKIRDLEAEEAEAHQAINIAQQICSAAGNTTKEEVGRLRDELESFQHLHRWKVLQYNASEIRLSHCEELCLVMRLVPEGVDRLELTLLQGKETDELYRILRDFFFQRMKTIIEGEEGIYDGPAASLIKHITAAWASSHRLIAELLLVSSRFPVKVQHLTKKSRPTPFLRVAARLHSQSASASYNVLFEISGDEIFTNDLDSIVAEIGCAAEVKFGQVDREEVAYIVRDRVSHGGPRALLEACLEAEAKYP